MEFTPIKDFLKYLSLPTRRPFLDKVPNPIMYVSLLFLCSFLINILAIGLVNAAIVDLENIGNVFDELNYGFWTMFGLAVVGAPLVEEMIFRFPLRYKIPLSILISLIVSGFVAFLLHKTSLPDIKYVAALVMFGAINYFLLGNSNVDSEDEEEKLDRLFPIFFYLVAVTFALIHIYNYDSTQFSAWMTPFIVIPQFVLALFLGFVRMRIGIWASIYMHALNNFIPLVLYFSLKDLLPG